MSYIFQAAALLGMPYKKRSSNLYLIFNEVCVTVYLYFLIAVSDFTDCEQPLREKLGWCPVATIFVCIGVNLLNTVAIMF